MSAYKDKLRVQTDAVNVIDGEDVVDEVANRPHDQAWDNEDSLASAFNADRFLVFRGGGNVTWDADGPTLTFSENLYIGHPNEEIGTSIGGAYEHVLQAGTIAFGTNRVAALRISRTTNSTQPMSVVEKFSSLDAFKTQVESLRATTQDARFEYILIAVRNIQGSGSLATDLILYDGRHLVSKKTHTNQGATDTQYAQQDDHDLLSEIVNQNLNIRLLGGGNLKWDYDNTQLILGDDLIVAMPHNVLLTISAATLPAIAASQAYVLTFNRDDDHAGAISPAVQDLSAVIKTSSLLYILAVHHTDGRLIMADGTVYERGQTKPLGGQGSGVKWRFTGFGANAASFDFTTATGTIEPNAGAFPEYQVGGAELLVWRNGVLQTNRGVEATQGDYTEVGADGDLSTEITWHQDLGADPLIRYPQADDVIVAMVGLSNPNRGEIGPAGGLNSLDVEDSVGTSATGGNPLQGDVALRMSADETVELSVAASHITVEVGDSIRRPVVGEIASPSEQGALRALWSCPTPIWYGDLLAPDRTKFWISPGEFPFPLDTLQTEFRVFRLRQPLEITLSGVTALGSLSSADYPLPLYVYGKCPATDQNHGNTFEIGISLTPPVQLIVTDYHWLAYPSDTRYLFLGSVIGVDSTADDLPDQLMPFSRSGDRVTLWHNLLSELSHEETGSPVVGNFTLSGLTDRIPTTASSVFLLGKVEANVGANAVVNAKLLLGSDVLNGPPLPANLNTEILYPGMVSWQSPLSNPTGVIKEIEATTGVLEVPLWSSGATPYLQVLTSDDLASVTLMLVGYRESTWAPYRLRTT